MDSINTVFEKTKTMLEHLNLKIVQEDRERPWGGFYVIDNDQADIFIKNFFPEENPADLKLTNRLSPKILFVAPEKRLSWQYHYRRAEIWKCVEGSVSVATSFTDEESERQTLNPGDKIKLKQGERHRLIGLEGWGIVAEIWMHTDAENPSDENDIVRLQDDFNRK
jgi:mannose-6-phosphate isomerase